MSLGEDENVCGFLNLDDGFSVEEWVDVENMIRFLLDFDDSKSEKGCEDVVDKLPNDPFGMEGMLQDPTLPRDPFGMGFEATLAAALTVIGDLAYGFQADDDYVHVKEDDGGDEDDGDGDGDIDDSKSFKELSFVWTSLIEYEGEDEEMHTTLGDGIGIGIDDLMCFGCEKYEIEHEDVRRDGDVNVGVDMIMFVLEYCNLGIKELLSVERVCRSLRDAVRRDPFLWTSIHIDYPSSQKITNEDLLRLTDRAQGRLCCLSLVKCLKISKDGLKQVLERNLELTKLSVAGSSKLNGEGFLNNLKVFNSVAQSVARPGIKHLRIGDPIGLTNEHLNEYKLLLGADEDVKPNDYKPKPRFYRAGEIYLSLDDERAIDIEICPRCQKLGQVYDCPAENCQVKIHSTKTCRACIFCIARCIRCGCCLDNKAYEETFCFDFLCFDCLEELLFEDGVTLPPGQTYVHQMASYHFFLYS